MTVDNVYKFMDGMHSQTFNYLQSSNNVNSLAIKEHIKDAKVLSIRTVDFYMDCVQKNRPCNLRGMAK